MSDTESDESTAGVSGGDEADEQRAYLERQSTNVDLAKAHTKISEWTTDGWRPVHLQPEEDVYASVVVAAYTGVDMQLQDGLAPLKVHPFLLWLASMALFACQVILIGAVVLEVDQKRFTLSYVKQEHMRLDLDTVTKALLMMIVQVMLLGEIRASLDMAVFVVNPLNWMNRQEPEFQFETRFAFMYTNDWRILFVPMAMMACGCKFFVASYLSITSVSIIYTSARLTDAIFNGLALSFVADLDNAFWKVLAINFNINFEKDFKFKLVFPPRECATLENYQRLRKRQGMSALLSRRALVSLLLMIFYCKQVLYVLFVMDTTVLPTTVDICAAWSLTEGLNYTSSSSFLHPMARVVLGPFRHKLQTIANGGAGSADNTTYTSAYLQGTGKDLAWAMNMTGGVCHGEALERFHFWTRGQRMVERHFRSSVFGFSVVFFMVLAPILIDFLAQFFAEKRLKNHSE